MTRHEKVRRYARVLIQPFRTLPLNFWTRATMPFGLLLVWFAAQDNPGLGLLWAVMWALTSQFQLHSVWMEAWLAGFKEDKHAKMIVSMEEFMDLCEEHGVPMEKVARLVWGDGDD